MNTAEKVALTFLFCALTCSILGIILPYWYYASGTADVPDHDPKKVSFVMNLGLWKVCNSESDKMDTDTACDRWINSIDEMPSVYKWVRGLEITGACLLFLSIVLFISGLATDAEKKLKVWTACASLLAGVLITIGAAVFAANSSISDALKQTVQDLKKDGIEIGGFSLHASFALCIVASVISGSMPWVIRKTSNDEYSRV